MAAVHWNGKTLCRGKQQGQGQQKGHGQQGQGQQQGHSEGTWGLWGASQITTLHASHRCENDRAICIRRAQFKNKQTNGCKKKHVTYFLFILPTLHHLSHVFYPNCVIFPCLSTLHHIIHAFYQPCILSTLHYVIHIYIYIYISTLHHLIHVWTNPVPSYLHKYQPCTILSMFISNPASFYPCIIHPAFKVSSQSDKNVPQKHHLFLNFHTSNLTAVLKTWQGHHSILLMNRQSMNVYRYAELLIPTVCRENSSQRFHHEQPLQLKLLIMQIPCWKAAGFNSGHKKKYGHFTQKQG